MRGETRFKPLSLKGNEKPRVAPTDRLCNLPGCFKYIDMGDMMVRWGSFDLHIHCAENWCSSQGIDANYKN